MTSYTVRRGCINAFVRKSAFVLDTSDGLPICAVEFIGIIFFEPNAMPFQAKSNFLRLLMSQRVDTPIPEFLTSEHEPIHGSLMSRLIIPGIDSTIRQDQQTGRQPFQESSFNAFLQLTRCLPAKSALTLSKKFLQLSLFSRKLIAQL